MNRKNQCSAASASDAGCPQGADLRPPEVAQNTPLAFFLLILGCVLWGSALSVIKIALQDYNAFFIVFARMLIVALILSPFIFVKYRRVRIHHRRDLILLLMLAFCDQLGFFTFEALAMQYTSASQAGAIWALAPMLNMLAGWLILREKTTVPVIICFIAATAGVMTLTLAGEVDEHASNPILGNFLQIIALSGQAGFAIILRFLRGAYPTFFVVWVQNAVALLIYLPFVGLGAVPLPGEFNLGPFLILLYLAVCVSLGAQACSTYALGRLPVARVAALNNTIPVAGVVCGIVFLGESLLAVQWGACGMVLAAVLVSQYFQNRQARGLQA